MPKKKERGELLLLAVKKDPIMAKAAMVPELFTPGDEKLQTYPSTIKTAMGSANTTCPIVM